MEFIHIVVINIDLLQPLLYTEERKVGEGLLFGGVLLIGITLTPVRSDPTTGDRPVGKEPLSSISSYLRLINIPLRKTHL